MKILMVLTSHDTLGNTGRKTGFVAADYEKGDGKGCCRCRPLPGTGRSCERRDPPRGWCGSRSSLVAAGNQTLDFDEVRTPRLLSVNVGLPRDGTWTGKSARTAIWKSPVEGRRMVRKLNIDGDGQGDLAGHGGGSASTAAS
jgi:hypothetical protein